MDRIEFQRVLFKSAVLVMACDGEIHDNEIKEIKLISEKSYYFKDIDFDSELKLLIEEFNENEKKALENYFSQLKASEYSPVQQLQIIEIMLRIIHADNRVDENEMKFIQLTKSLLGVHSEIIVRRFGHVDILTKLNLVKNEKLSTKHLVDQIDLSGLQKVSLEPLKSSKPPSALKYIEDIPEVELNVEQEKNDPES